MGRRACGCFQEGGCPRRRPLPSDRSQHKDPFMGAGRVAGQSRPRESLGLVSPRTQSAFVLPAPVPARVWTPSCPFMAGQRRPVHSPHPVPTQPDPPVSHSSGGVSGSPPHCGGPCAPACSRGRRMAIGDTDHPPPGTQSPTGAGGAAGWGHREGCPQRSTSEIHRAQGGWHIGPQAVSPHRHWSLGEARSSGGEGPHRSQPGLQS